MANDLHRSVLGLGTAFFSMMLFAVPLNEKNAHVHNDVGHHNHDDEGVTAEQLDEAISELQRLRKAIPPGGTLKPPTPKEMIAQMEAFRKDPEFAKLPVEQRQQFEEGLAQLRREAARKPSAVRRENSSAAVNARPSPYVAEQNGQRVYFIPKGSRH